MHPAVAQPEVGAATRFQPDGWGQGRPATLIDDERPARPGRFQEHQFDRSSAPARATKAHRPVLPGLGHEYEVTTPKRCWEGVALEPSDPSRRGNPRPEPHPSGRRAHKDTGGARRGRPSRGSAAPVPRRGFGDRVKSDSALSVSSPTARLNRACAYRPFGS